MVTTSVRFAALGGRSDRAGDRCQFTYAKKNLSVGIAVPCSNARSDMAYDVALLGHDLTVAKPDAAYFSSAVSDGEK